MRQACAADEALRREVLSLLAAHERAGEFLDHSPVAAGGLPPDPRIGLHLGAYRLEQRLGDGGMGAVYLAQRADAEFHKRVAIKLLRRGLESSGWVQRFQAERQILAALDHPNIAKLLDGGTTPEGLPYLVMEFIEGEPIDRFCDSRKLSLQERTRLFRKVCAAVHFAHQNLVVHRDLKPSNILVTADGTVKLLDFGIAKLLNPELSAKSIVATSEVMRLMTPEYASPEQMSGQPISTASDVYSLGVLLYRLLAGRPPYEFDDCSPAEIVEQVCRRAPEPPSTAVKSATEDGDGKVDIGEIAALRGTEVLRLGRALRGDLDTIVLEALRKEPYRRYPSAAELGEDLDRFERGLPVRARSDSFAYRWGKFLRRNAVSASLAAALMLAVLGFAGALLVQRGELVQERDRVAAARLDAEQLVGFLRGLFESANRTVEPEQLTVRDLLDRGGELLRNGHLTADSATRQTFHRTLAEIYRDLGFYDEARQHALAASELARRGPAPAALATALSLLGGLELQLGDLEAAEQVLQEAARTASGLASEDPARWRVAGDLGLLLLYQGRYEAAEAEQRKALAGWQQDPSDQPLEVAEAHDRLATILLRQGRQQAAEQSYRQALETLRRMGSQPWKEARILSNLANLRLQQGQLEAAEELFGESLAILRQLFDRPHPTTAVVLFSLASAKFRQDEMEPAAELFAESLAIRRQTLAAEHPEIGRSLIGLATAMRSLGRKAEAKALLAEALVIFRRGARHADLLATNLYHLANVELDLGRPAEARASIAECLQILQATEGDVGWQVLRAESVLGGALLEQGELAAAEALLSASHTGLAALRPEALETHEAAARLAALYRRTGRVAAAEKLLEADG